MAARLHRLVLSNTAPTIQPCLLMSMAGPDAPPLGAGSTSIPPPTGHFTGSPESKYGPGLPTASPPSSTTLAQALVGLARGDQREPLQVHAVFGMLRLTGSSAEHLVSTY
jgi:hypothetical protein